MSTIARFEIEICSADAIQRAAYRMSDRVAVEIRRVGTVFECELWSCDGGEPSTRDVAAFHIEVTDYALRERIRRETEPVRNTVLALAFSNAEITEDQ